MANWKWDQEGWSKHFMFWSTVKHWSISLISLLLEWNIIYARLPHMVVTSVVMLPPAGTNHKMMETFLKVNRSRNPLTHWPNNQELLGKFEGSLIASQTAKVGPTQADLWIIKWVSDDWQLTTVWMWSLRTTWSSLLKRTAALVVSGYVTANANATTLMFAQ